MSKKTPHMIATHWEPPKIKAIKPLSAERAVRHKRAFQHRLKDGDITKAEFDAIWAKTLERVKAGV